jgi:hypothetical protein
MSAKMVQLQPFPFLRKDLVPLSASLNPTKAGLVTQLKIYSYCFMGTIFSSTHENFNTEVTTVV